MNLKGRNFLTLEGLYTGRDHLSSGSGSEIQDGQKKQAFRNRMRTEAKMSH